MRLENNFPKKISFAQKKALFKRVIKMKFHQVMTRLNSNSTDNRINNQLEQIIREMDSMSHSKRAETIKRLGQMDLQIEDLPIMLHSKLVKALSDPSSEVRKETVMTLAFLEGEIAIPILEPLLDDPIQSVQSNTIAALSFIGVTPTPDISEKMMNFLKVPEFEIRDRCARALGRLKVSKAKEHLLKLARTDSVPAVRAGAVVGLGMLESGNPQLKMEISQLLKSETSTPVISTIHETLTLIETSILKADNYQK